MKLQRKNQKNEVHSWWMEYKALVRLHPVKLDDRVMPSLFLPEVRTLWKSITEIDIIRTSYFTNMNLLERSATIHYAQSFDYIINYIESHYVSVMGTNYFIGSKNNYIEYYSLELLNYVFSSEEFEDLEFDFVYWGPVEVVYNTVYLWGNISVNTILKWVMAWLISYCLLFWRFLYSLEVFISYKFIRKDNTFAFLFPWDEGLPVRIMLKNIQYKSINKALVVCDLLPSLTKVILFRFVMYMRLNILRRLYAIVYKFVSLCDWSSKFCSMGLFILVIAFTEI